MKRCKHALSLFLAILMVLSTMVANVPTIFAESTNQAKIGTTEYATLKEAITAAADGDTITLLSNVAWGENTSAYTIKKTITIDGGESTKYKITYTGYATTTTKFYLWDIYQSVTLKNLTFDTSHGFRFYNTSGKEAVVTLENVNWTLAGGLLTNIQGSVEGVTQTLNVKNCTITKKAVNGDPIIATYGSDTRDVVINVENSTLNQNGGSTNNGAANRSIFFFCNGKTATLNLKGTTTLNGNFYGTASLAQSLICYRRPVTVNVESTVTTKIAGGTSSANYFLYTDNGKGTLTLNDSGASWTVSATIAKRGFYAPYAGSFDVNGTEKALVTATSLCTGITELTYKKASATYSASDLTTVVSKSASGMIFEVGGKTYSTWSEALAVGGEIKLIAYTPMITSKISLTKDVVIDGQNLYSLTASTYFFDLNGKNATFKNLTINTTHGVRTDDDPNPNVVFDNCKVTVTGGLLVNFNKNANVTFKDTTVTSTAADAFILIQNGATSNINLENSTITYTKGATNLDSNTSIFNIAGASIANLTIDGTSKVVYQPSNAVSSNQMAIIQNTSKLTVNLKAGAVLEYNTVPSTATSLAFFRVTQTANLILNDEGATWTVSEAVGKKGLRYVNNTATGTLNTDIVALTTTDGKLYSLTDVVNLTAKTSMTAVNMGLTNTAGASIRISEPTGIRFETEIDKDFYNALGTSAVYGVKVALESTLQSTAFSALTDDNSVTVTTADTGFKWVTAGEKFRTVLLDIDSANYATELAWNAFVTITYEDGDTATFWADYVKADNCRSLKAVATSALADTEANWTTEETAILNSIAGND